MDRDTPYRDANQFWQNMILPLNLSYTAAIRTDHTYTSPFYSSPVVGNVNGQNMVFLGSVDANLFAFTASGAPVWMWCVT